MKKYIKFTFILIILAGILSPIAYADAQVVLGSCTYNESAYGLGTGEVTVGMVTETYCKTKPRWKWAANPPASAPSGDSGKLCTYDDKGLATNEPCVGTSNYKLLAPLPGLNSVPVGETNALGNYLNIIIKLIIGLAAVAAMVMIVMGGIQYMTSELPGVKGEGKEKITNAIIGLLIALGAWLILYTINPDLLDTKLNIAQTTIQYAEAPPTAADFQPANTPIPGGTVGSCTQGIVVVTAGTSRIPVCGSIATRLKGMLDKAVTAGFNIGGWGWRSNAKQIELRTKNGCPDVYKSPPTACKIPTAIPGTSMHESGLAVDLTCDGVAIQTKDNKCFLWLQTNAGGFGLTNLKIEPWHWSTNGG